ncbi:MAG: aldo/keto reductase [Rhodobacteraceae bacterium]|nr:aldo/keto reductase [Paracoccaceae bacterium]
MVTVYFMRNYQRAFGTFPLTGKSAAEAVEAAAAVGYRAFDTAQMYQNEDDVGAALAATGIARKDLCITTKVHPDNFRAEKFMMSVEASLKALRTDFVDVLLLHWPPADGDIAPSLQLLEDAHKRGLAASIGVSNYTVAMLEAAAKIIETPIITNQVEFHPLLDQSVLLAGASRVGIPLSAYSTVARGEVFKHPEFAEIGASYGKSAGQVVLRWILQKGVSVNTMSTRTHNMHANYDIMDFALSHVDMARIDALTHTNYRIVTKDLVPWAPEWD